MNSPEMDYPCVGVCMVDGDGYCQGCGRPPQSVQTPAADNGDATLVAASAESRVSDSE